MRNEESRFSAPSMAGVRTELHSRMSWLASIAESGDVFTFKDDQGESVITVVSDAEGHHLDVSTSYTA